MLGLLFGAIALLPIDLVVVTALFYVALLSGDWMLYVALGVTAPPWRWTAEAFTREVALKATFAIAGAGQPCTTGAAAAGAPMTDPGAKCSEPLIS